MVLVLVSASIALTGWKCWTGGLLQVIADILESRDESFEGEVKVRQ